jgi:hypothetical protein
MQRYFLPVVPFIVVMIAYLVDWLLGQWFNKKHLIFILILLVSGQTLYLTLLFDTKIMQADTRLLAQQWIYRNIPANSSINNVSLPKLYLNENKEAVALIKSRKPELFSTKRKYLKNLSLESYPYPSYFVVTHQDLIQAYQNFTKESFGRQDLIDQFDYIIIGDFNFNSLADEQKQLPEGSKKIKSFYPVNDFSKVYPNAQLDRNSLNPWQIKDIDIGGPYIEIYRID